MQKKKPYSDSLKQQRQAGIGDRLHNFLMADGAIRGAILQGTRMVNEMRAKHALGILETLVLGRAYLGAGLMSAELKGNDRISLKIECSGPVKGLTVEANALGEVRGFLHRIPIPLEKPMEDFDLAPFFGAGFLSITRHLQGARQPFTGRTMLKFGNIARDLAYYYLVSQQIPTAFNLSIKFDRAGMVTGAGGLFLQAMPGLSQNLAADLEQRVVGLPSLGEVFARGGDPESLVVREFKEYSPRFLTDRQIEFVCHCSRARSRSLLALLPIDELKDMCAHGPFPLEIRCHHCNATYLFSRSEIKQIYGLRFPDN